MHVLSVDDSAIMRKIIRGAVDILGFDFLEAVDGQDAMSVLEQRYTDVGLILMDWNMPNKNGYEALVDIRADERFKSIPVIMVTTETERLNIIKAIQAGANHYVTKPFNQEDLLTRMMECLGMN